jgi:hypothetical protein
MTREEFRREEDGILLCVDIAGYGTVANDGPDRRNLDLRVSRAADEFRFGIATSFWSFLMRVGLTQVQLAGDGFICALPSRIFEGSLEQELRRLLHEYLRIVLRLNEQCVSAEHVSVGSRLAVHSGRYRFGRIALAHQASVGFEGATVIEVARLEAALRDRMRAMRAEGSRIKHSMILSAHLLTAGKQLGGILPDGVEPLGDISVQIKEYAASGSVFALDSAVLPNSRKT